MARREDRRCEICFFASDDTPLDHTEVYQTQYAAVVRLQRLGFMLNGKGPDEVFSVEDEFECRPWKWKAYHLLGQWNGRWCTAHLIWDDAHMHPAHIATLWVQAARARQIAPTN